MVKAIKIEPEFEAQIKTQVATRQVYDRCEHRDHCRFSNRPSQRVQGNTVRSKHAGRDIAASFKNLVGGELKGYTELLTESRREAVERMMGQAQQLGANAIVNVRFTTSAVTAGAAELYAYGTAVVVQPLSLIHI